MSEYDTVSDMPDDYQLVTGSHERDMVLQHIGEDTDKWSHGSLFVQTGEGEYTSVYFFAGNVPYLYKDVTKVL